MHEIHFPAEWAPQDAILITWPHPNSAWESMLEQVTRTYVELTTRISHYQRLIIQLDDSLDINAITARLSKAEANLSNCHFVSAIGNDTWARDHGPISIVKDGNPTLCDFIFNGWGNKFDATLDNQLNRKLSNKNVITNLESHDWVLEGGSIESDGDGSLMTTTACLLNSNRNGNVTKSNIETQLKETFGSTQVLWLHHGELAGDDTDAHVDTLARFAPNSTIIYQGCDDKSDSHFEALRNMAMELAEFKNSKGEPYSLVELPFPKPIFADDGHRLPATYANFLICNDLVVVPIYKDEADNIACERIQRAFPEHIVVPIDARPLIEEHGSIHCITMQLTKGTLSKNAEYVTPGNLSTTQ